MYARRVGRRGRASRGRRWPGPARRRPPGARRPSSGVRSARMSPVTPAEPSATQDRAAVPPTQQLVDVAHAHDGRAGSGVRHPLHERQRAVERRSRGQGDAARSLEGRAVRQRIGVRQPELQQVRARIDEPERDPLRERRVRVAGHGVRDERGASVGCRGRGTPRRCVARPRCRPRQLQARSCADPQSVRDGREVLVAATGQPQQHDRVIGEWRQRRSCRRATHPAPRRRAPVRARAGCPPSG